MLIRNALSAASLLAILSAAGFAQVPQAQERPAQQPAKPAAISYNDGKISISAENASLNQILRDISRQTGIRITGSVDEERVYGNYGPAAPGAILTQLLDGAGSNMLLVQSPGAPPTEVILTPRHGGPSPPDPNAEARERAEAAARERAEQERNRNLQQPPIGPPGRVNPMNRFPQNRPEMNVPNNAPNSANPNQPGVTTQQSPNGVPTPQQINNQNRNAGRQPFGPN